MKDASSGGEKGLFGRIVQAGKDGVLYGVSAFVVTPFTIATQNVKAAVQSKGSSHKQAITALYSEGGARRFGNGFVPYTGRNIGVSSVGGVALEEAGRLTKEIDCSDPVKGAVKAAVAGALETVVTAGMEGAELTKTKNIPSSSIMQVFARSAGISPLLFARNAVYWGGAVVTDHYADKHKLSMDKRASMGTAAGFATGIASTPFDCAATAAFGEKTLSAAVSHIISNGPKEAFRGTMLRGVQMGMFTGTAVVAMQLNKRLRGDVETDGRSF